MHCSDLFLPILQCKISVCPFFTDSYDASTDGHAHRDPDKDEPSTSSARSKGATTRSRHHEHNEGFLAGVAIGVASGALVLLG